MIADGRLSLASGKPVMDADTVSSNVFYPPVNGCEVLIEGVARNFLSGPTDQVGPIFDVSGHAPGLYDYLMGWDGSSVFPFTAPAWNPPAETLIAPVSTITTGTGSTAWTRPDAAFNGTVNQAVSAASRNGPSPPSNSGLNNFLGQDFGTPHYISKVKLYPPYNDYFRGDTSASVPVEIHGWNEDTSAWDTIYAGTVDSSAAPVNPAVPYILHTTCFRSYSKVIVGIAGNGANAINAGQIQFYEWTQSRTADLTRYNGIMVNAASMTGRKGGSTFTCAQYAGTHLGTIRVGTDGKCRFHVSLGGDRHCDVWNRYNQETIILTAYADGLGIYTPPVVTPDWGPLHGDANNCVTFVTGEPQRVHMGLHLERGVKAGNYTGYYNNGQHNCAIGLNRTDAPDGQLSATTLETTFPWNATIVDATATTAPLITQPILGTGTAYAIENASNPGVVDYGGAKQTILWARLEG